MCGPGWELPGRLRRQLDDADCHPHCRLYSRSRILSSHPPRAREAALREAAAVGVAVCEHAAVERVQKVPRHLLPMGPAMQQLWPALESHYWFRLQSVHNLLHAAGAAAAGERGGRGF
jgi:hypothetical protein